MRECRNTTNYFRSSEEILPHVVKIAPVEDRIAAHHKKMEDLPRGWMFTVEEQEEMLRQMKEISSAFYGPATRVGNHAFIEFCGLMNEYIQICRNTMKHEIDFTTCNKHSGVALIPADHQVDYLVEKFDCIFGSMFNKRFRDRFIQKMGWVDAK